VCAAGRISAAGARGVPASHLEGETRSMVVDSGFAGIDRDRRPARECRLDPGGKIRAAGAEKVPTAGCGGGGGPVASEDWPVRVIHLLERARKNRDGPRRRKCRWPRCLVRPRNIFGRQYRPVCQGNGFSGRKNSSSPGTRNHSKVDQLQRSGPPSRITLSGLMCPRWIMPAAVAALPHCPGERHGDIAPLPSNPSAGLRRKKPAFSRSFLPGYNGMTVYRQV